MSKHDVIIIGGGIVGLSTAYHLLQKKPSLNIAILEKERQVAKHQTGRNSGVIHSGIYYPSNSLKAKMCVEGAKKLFSFCKNNDIPINKCGKLIIATKQEDLPILSKLYNQGIANGVQGLEKIDSDRIEEIEPCAYGIQALYSPNTAIVDFKKVSKALAQNIKKQDGHIFFNQHVKNIAKTSEKIIIETKNKSFSCSYLINCAGLYSDRIAKMMLKDKSLPQIIPFRGEYFYLKKEKRQYINGLIYPVPNPALPFLGIHLTKMIDGNVKAGPNAVLAYSREGYRKRHINIKDCAQMLSYKGFWKMATTHFKTGIFETIKSFSKKIFIKELQKFVPSIQEKDLQKGLSGVRAQLVFPNGKLSDDFFIQQDDRSLHVLNAPSPAATASLAIGKKLSLDLIQKIR